MLEHISGNKNYFFELQQLSQKAQYILMQECNSYKCYYVFNLIYSEIKKLENYMDKPDYTDYFIYNGKKIADISTGEFKYLLNFSTQDVRRALQRLQEKGYIEQIALNFGNTADEEIMALQMYSAMKYGYAITEKGYRLINNLES